MRGFENRYELAHLISCRLMGTITPEEEERSRLPIGNYNSIPKNVSPANYA